MVEFDRKYLNSLIDETNKKGNKFRFSPPDETGAEISYISSKLRIYFPGSIGSLDFQRQMEACKTEEKSKLRKGTQNYFRILRRDGRILRIDSFVHGRCDVIRLMHYEGNRRYAFPFSKTGGFYPTYIQVQVYDNDGDVVEDYMVRSKQIVYSTYTRHSTDTVQYRCINYVQGGQEPLIGKEEGYYTLSEPLTYTQTYNWAWYAKSADELP